MHIFCNVFYYTRNTFYLDNYCCKVYHPTHVLVDRDVARVVEVCTDVFLSREERYWWYKLTASGIVELFLQHSFN